MRIAVIVPVLDEARALPALAAQLPALGRDGAEVLVVDGGSSDGTAPLAEAAGLRVRRAGRVPRAAADGRHRAVTP